MTTIIIVDDDEEILAPLEKMLSAEGYFVKAFSSSLKAEAYLKGNSADLAIFDIKMPELNGFFFFDQSGRICPICRLFSCPQRLMNKIKLLVSH